MKQAAIGIYVLLLTQISSKLATCDDYQSVVEEMSPIVREYSIVDSKSKVPVTIYPPHQGSQRRPALLVYLYGSGGSHTVFNLQASSCERLRKLLAERNYYVVVPNLGPRHWMNREASQTLEVLIDQWTKEWNIDGRRVSLMGTSMGAGSALAYGASHPNSLRSICAVMPMTDFAKWAREMPAYGAIMQDAYGGESPSNGKTFQANSAILHADAFARTPLLLIHGTGDQIVPFAHSRSLEAILHAKQYPCTLHTVEGMGHSDEIMKNLQTETVDFFDAAMSDNVAIPER
ncbi:alpha/beta hydrolase family protein [Bythopirellula goksoeyrii]|uniref:Esterase n=1 Tax=Bythopirellula goksoeyrii TaxID=1400387 RepID=A0A5B9Q348_9BACT|nr:prolyl oligopeptidase family serine peptidase [Bythopirellula goksoeyrii]QEG33424.1 esterase [Bythopirellula goksoeyrii]